MTSTADAAPITGPAASVARGGALNLIGALVYGACNFVLLIVLNRSLGVRTAGVIVVAIALFNIVTTVCGLGTSTGLVRTISKERATGRVERLPATVRTALGPVLIVSTAVALGAWFLVEPVTHRFASGSNPEMVPVLRAMIPFIPAATLHTVVVQATRGFDTMVPQVAIERIGRALSLPLVVIAAATLDLRPAAVAAAWAGTNLVALGFSWRALSRRVEAAVAAAPRSPVRRDRAISRAFWAFTAPRAVGQASEVVVNWMDTVIVGAVLSTTAAGIYASGTRYLLPGLFAAEALMQVTGPRVSGLLARRRTHEASVLVQVVAGWQVAVLWPFFLLVGAFPTPLLRVFGPEVVAARTALIALAASMLIASLAGPAASTILMAGRSRQAMGNTLLLVAVNVSGNLILVPRHGIGAAGAVWGVTIILAAALPCAQARYSLGVTTLGRPAFTAAGVAAATVGVAAALGRMALGDDLDGLVAAGILGGVTYLVALRSVRHALHIDTLWAGLRRRPQPGDLQPSATRGSDE